MTTLTQLPTETKVQLLRHEIIHQTLIRLRASRQGNNTLALDAEIERDIVVKAINRIQPKNKETTVSYESNTTQWRKGDLVLADSDAKEPKMLMEVIGYTRDGLCKTQYLFKSRKRTIWKNEIKYLHNPEQWIPGASQWQGYSQEYLEICQRNFEHVRRWNRTYQIGQSIVTTSADGGFETTTTSKAYLDKAGQSLISLDGIVGGWSLEFVKPVIG